MHFTEWTKNYLFQCNQASNLKLCIAVVNQRMPCSPPHDQHRRLRPEPEDDTWPQDSSFGLENCLKTKIWDDNHTIVLATIPFNRNYAGGFACRVATIQDSLSQVLSPGTKKKLDVFPRTLFPIAATATMYVLSLLSLVVLAMNRWHKECNIYCLSCQLLDWECIRLDGELKSVLRVSLVLWHCWSDGL